MKLLVYYADTYLDHDIIDTLSTMHIQYNIFKWDFSENIDELRFEDWMNNQFSINDYDAIFSMNYFPMISSYCNDNNIKYISWCYDSPLSVREIGNTLENLCNYVFMFDKKMTLGYRSKGFDTVHHLPLGVNCKRMKEIEINEEDMQKYGSDISFTGSLCETNLFFVTSYLDDYLRGYINSLVDIQANIYGYLFLSDVIKDSVVLKIQQLYGENSGDTAFSFGKDDLVNVMARETTRKERLMLLNLFGKHHKMKCYSPTNSGLFDYVEHCDPVDYINEMPKVFRCSKINLNPTLRCIQTGIPLRAYNIMGSGGFLLSNFQEELYESYIDGEEFIMYESYADAAEKVQFYLKHEELRKKISERGCVKTLEEHNLKLRLQSILSMAKIT